MHHIGKDVEMADFLVEQRDSEVRAPHVRLLKPEWMKLAILQDEANVTMMPIASIPPFSSGS